MRGVCAIQVPTGIDARCVGTAYPPTAVPQHWAQQQQQQRLVVPEPPDLSRVLGPREQVRLGGRGVCFVCICSAAAGRSSSVLSCSHLLGWLREQWQSGKGGLEGQNNKSAPSLA